MTYDDFSDIAPFDDSQFQSHMARLVTEPGFEHAVKWVLHDVDYPAFAEKLKGIKSQDAFQHDIMVPFLELLASKTTAGISASGIENYRQGENYTMITNHRDIVLDASFLNLCLVRKGFPTSEIAIGNNLLIYPWIDELVRLNKSFVVKRNVGVTHALEAARQLSSYIHYAINVKHESVWIAQREGRAKDSNDVTQESLIKMLGLGGEGSFEEKIREINLMPVAISYEFDPNDYLKAREFLLRRNNPDFKKSQRDDLFSMETGLLQFKGRVHFTLSPCINTLIADLPQGRAEAVRMICDTIDRAIHAGYKSYPINYIAYDELSGTRTFADRYTDADIDTVNDYINSQLAKVDIPDLTSDDMNYMRRMMLTMYSNPLRNQLKL
ncbi:MAG: 1-acyl-sn-glycerol-3-phosphate acyltransferase [Muribaculaceae bacterium]|nr:1-acyl-sn-glycerol-3-phosphate acyltransferase [Muribaculaceae bacterium]